MTNTENHHWQADLVVEARLIGGDGDTSRTWHVPEEVPVALVYDGANYAVMLATPQDMQDFATGFSITERIIDHPRDILSLTISERAEGIDLLMTLSKRHSQRLALRQGRRNLAGRSGCGLCGLDNAESLFEPLPRVSETPIRLDPRMVGRAVDAFAERQPLKLLNRSVHGAAFVGFDGGIELVREDIGRHNALDKLLGALARADADAKAGFVLISSRCSYEIVEKAARMGVTAIVGLSAPTGFAIRKARQAGLALHCWSKDGLINL